MIRCTARSVIPTRTATSRNTSDASCDSSIKTCEWLVRNVHRLTGAETAAAVVWRPLEGRDRGRGLRLVFLLMVKASFAGRSRARTTAR